MIKKKSSVVVAAAKKEPDTQLKDYIETEPTLSKAIIFNPLDKSKPKKEDPIKYIDTTTRGRKYEPVDGGTILKTVVGTKLLSPNTANKVVLAQSTKTEESPYVSTKLFNIVEYMRLYILDHINDMLEEYWGTPNGELFVQNFGIYERQTFSRLLSFHCLRIMFERESELVNFGRLRFSLEEITKVYKSLGTSFSKWMAQYDQLRRTNSEIIIGDIGARQSEKFPWIEGWLDWDGFILRYTVLEEAATRISNRTEILNSSRGDILDDLITGFLEENVNDVSDGRLSTYHWTSRFKIRNSDLYPLVLHARNGIVGEKFPYISEYKDTFPSIKARITSFIDYAANELFSDKVYLPSNKQENFYSSLKNNSLPDLGTFKDFINARAFSESYCGAGDKTLQEGLGSYRENEISSALRLTREYINLYLLRKYINLLYLNDRADLVTDEYPRDNAFGYKIPTDDVLREALRKIKLVADDQYSRLESGIKRNFSDDDKNTWASLLKNTVVRLEDEENIDRTFTEPFADKILSDLERNVSTLYRSSGTGGVNRDKSKILYANGTVSDSSTVWRPDMFFSVSNSGVKPSAAQYVSSNGTGIAHNYDKTLYRSTLTDQGYKTTLYKTNKDIKRKQLPIYDPTKYDFASKYINQYHTFSGHDMVVVVSIPLNTDRTKSINKVIGAFQTITYSIHNEKVPIRCLGDMNAKRYVFGPRTIAGTLILTVFDRHWLREIFGEYRQVKNATERYWLSDEMPAMDITISMANEYGYNARLAIYGVTIVNEGQVMSINDVYTENTYQFFATGLDVLDAVDSFIASKKKKEKEDRMNNKVTSPVNRMESTEIRANPVAPWNVNSSSSGIVLNSDPSSTTGVSSIVSKPDLNTLDIESTDGIKQLNKYYQQQLARTRDKDELKTVWNACNADFKTVYARVLSRSKTDDEYRRKYASLIKCGLTSNKNTLKTLYDQKIKIFKDARKTNKLTEVTGSASAVSG